MSTRFYLSIAKVEGTGEYTVEALMEKIRKAIFYVYCHRLDVIVQDDNTLRITHIESRSL